MPHLVQAASVLLLAAVAEASCLSWCIAPLLPGKAGQSLFALPEDHLSTRIKSASATRVGEIGEYLQCRRLRNESSGEAAAHYALVQFEQALMPHPTSQFYGCCVPASCASIDVESGLLVELPDLLALATASLRQTDRALGALDEALIRLNNVSSFLGVEAQLRVEASRANASAMPALAGALAAAAEAAEGAAQLDRGLREAGKLAAQINNSKLERALAAADEALRAGPAGGWRASLFSLRAELGEKTSQLHASVLALEKLQGVVGGTTFKVLEDDQRSPLSSVGVAAIVTAAALLALAALATAEHALSADSSTLAASVAPLCSGGAAASSAAATSLDETGRDLNNPFDSAAAGGAVGGAASAAPKARRGSASEANRGLPIWSAALRCFSLKRNWASLGALRSDTTMNSLDGMRCLSMAWVIFGHTLIYGMGSGSAG